MYHIVTSETMKNMEQKTMEGFGVSSLVLMERAALSVCDCIEELQIDAERALIVCGTGNNGGDGLAIGRILYENGYDPTIVMIGNRSRCTESVKKQIETMNAYGIPIYDTIPKNAYTTVIDALFGIGLNREIEGVYIETIEQMNKAEGVKIAVDIPSGIHADTGNVMGCAFHADITVTFSYQKVGTLLFPGADYVGKQIVKNIGIIENAYDSVKPQFIAYGDDDIELPTKPAYSHKGTYGKVLAVAGCKNMCGAAILSAEAAYRTGAGMVKIYTEEANRVIVQERLPEAMLDTYQTGQFIPEDMNKSIRWADVIMIGPGMSQSETAKQIVHYALSESTCPIIIDADALNIIALADDADEIKNYFSQNREIIITPHPAEMARLCKKEVSDVREHIIDTAHSFAIKHQITCVLKDARTIVSKPDEPDYINLSGNSGMATAGSGDVLCGVIAGLLAQKYSVYKAASLGVYLHGLAGDMAAVKYGKHVMTATDIICELKQLIHAEEGI